MKSKIAIIFAGFYLLCSLSINGQAARDTVYYEIKSPMIGQAAIHEFKRTEEYFIHIKLKDHYHEEFANLTGSNIGNDLAVQYEGEIIAPSLPTIQARIPSGRFQLGPYKTKKKATGVRKWILGGDE